MVDILEHPAIRRIVTPLTVEMYHRLSELGPDTQPTELIRGIVVDKTDKMSRSQLHIYLVRRLLRLVQAAVLDLEMFVIKEDPITLADSEPEPDIAVIDGREEAYDHARPTTARLVMEVSVTSLALDRKKAALYAEANVPEYWIVLAHQNAIEVYTAPVAGLYTQCITYQRGETILTTALPSLRVELVALFAD